MNESIRHLQSDNQFAERQRQRVIQDIAHWKRELDIGANETDSEDLDGFISELNSLGDGELTSRWNETVGEWVLSRDDLPRPCFVDADTYLDVQFAKLVAGFETDYGFVVSVHVPEPAANDPRQGLQT